MTVVLKITKQIAFDDLVERLKCDSIKIVTGYEAEPFFYLCLAGLRCALTQTITDTVGTWWCLTIAIFHCRSSMQSCMNSTAELRDWLMIAVAQ